MNTSSDLFKGRAFAVFSIKEINEVLLALYIELESAVHDREDTLMLDRQVLSHLKRGEIKREWPMIYGSSSIYELARSSLLKILERDRLVTQYFVIEEINDDMVKIRRRTEHSGADS